MPAYVINRAAEALNAQRKPVNGSCVLVLGLAYKPNVDDDRESPSYVLMDLLGRTRRGRCLLRSLCAGDPADARTSALGGHAFRRLEQGNLAGI